jgi:N-acetyl-alpha-D-muramate 1-phosphate uridylyltransferase
MIAMILAAGRGERMRPITDTVPKALLQVRGETLLERHLRALHGMGAGSVVINLGWLGDSIVDRIGSGADYGLDVIYSPEGEHVLETGGGIHRALPLLGDDPFLVINADVYTDMPLPRAELRETDLGHLVLVPSPPHRRSGDFELVDGRVRNGDPPDLTFSGVAVYRPALFAGQDAGRFPLTPLLRSAADADRLGGSVYAGLWEDVGTPKRLAELNL